MLLLQEMLLFQEQNDRLNCFKHVAVALVKGVNGVLDLAKQENRSGSR